MLDAHEASQIHPPALTEATSPYWRPIKYSLFPPLGLATLAAYLDPDVEATIQDEHVEPLTLDDHPDLVVIQVYITNAYRAYRIADHYRRAARMSHSAACTSPLSRTKPRRTRTRSFSVREKTPSRIPEDLAAGQPANVRLDVRTSKASRRSGAI
jgi:hypothetical protein